MIYAAAAKERSGFIGDNLKKHSIFAVKNLSGCYARFVMSTTNAHESSTAVQEPFQVSSMAVLYLYKKRLSLIPAFLYVLS